MGPTDPFRGQTSDKQTSTPMTTSTRGLSFRNSVAHRVSVTGVITLILVLTGICTTMALVAAARSRARIVTWVADKTQSVADAVDAFDMTSRVLVEKFFQNFRSEFNQPFSL